MARYNEVGKHKTRIGSEHGYTFIQYHATKVVQFNFGSVILNSGGYLTKTTKLRMNQASEQFNLGYFVWQKKFEWFVDYDGETLEFYDGMVLERNQKLFEQPLLI